MCPNTTPPIRFLWWANSIGSPTPYRDLQSTWFSKSLRGLIIPPWPPRSWSTRRWQPIVRQFRACSCRTLSVVLGGAKLLCNISTGVPRHIVSTAWRRRAFEMLHTLAHPSIRATMALVAARFMCRRRLDIERALASCARPPRCTDMWQEFTIPWQRFDHIDHMVVVFQGKNQKRPLVNIIV